MVLAAIERGVDFLPGTAARLGRNDRWHRYIDLSSNQGDVEISARMVVAADGLREARFLARRDEEPEWVSSKSWIGAGTNVPATFIDVPAGAILMAVGRSGYVGLTRIEDGSINIAAAIDPSEIKRLGGMGSLASTLLRSSGISIDSAVEETPWKGARLTRRPAHLGAERVLVVGDAAGYIEPFTGQGIAWAIESGRRVAPFVDQAVIEGWSPSIIPKWRNTYQRAIVKHQRLCRNLSWGLRSSVLVRCGLNVVRHFPAIAEPFTRSLDW